MDLQPESSLTLSELNRRISSALATTPGISNVWVTAETSDLRCSGGHCYMELLQKDERGAAIAKARAVIWASTFARLAPKFESQTGSRLASDMKVMVRVSVNFHSVYGFSLVINDIDPSYTAGDLLRRRNEMIARLKADGVFDLNRTIPWPARAYRIAVVSAPGAAGYGDFLRQLYGNALRLRFHAELFEAVMQGERAPSSILSALERIMERDAEFDCVVVIRGGGAGSDLACFDNYELASAIAQFPLPVVVGIGHERDVTVLDYVANKRVKTPTAAAELLISSLTATYAYLIELGRGILTAATDKLSGQHRQLEYFRGQIPALVRSVTARAAMRLENLSLDAFRRTVAETILRQHQRLDSFKNLLEALSPEATLRRGYSITRFNGHAVTDASEVPPGSILETTFAKGTIKSTTE